MEIAVKKLRCSKCGGEGYRTSYETYDGLVRVVTRCSKCGHEKLLFEYQKIPPVTYSAKELDEIELF